MEVDKDAAGADKVKSDGDGSYIEPMPSGDADGGDYHNKSNQIVADIAHQNDVNQQMKNETELDFAKKDP